MLAREEGSAGRARPAGSPGTAAPQGVAHPAPGTAPRPGDPPRATGGTTPTTAPPPAARRWSWSWSWSSTWLGLGLVVAAGCWGDAARQAGELAKLVRSTHPQQYSRGHALTEEIDRLDGLLFRYQLTGDPLNRTVFLEESTRWIAQLGEGSAAAEALRRYMTAAAPLLERNRPALRRDTARQLVEEIGPLSVPVRTAARALVAEDAALWTLRQEEWSQRQRGVFVRGLGGMAALMMGILGFVLSRPTPRSPLPSTAVAAGSGETAGLLSWLIPGLAHDLRHPLAFLRTELHRLRSEAPGSATMVRDLEEEVRRMDRMLEEVLTEVGPSDLPATSVDPAQLLRSLAQLARRTFAERGLQLETDLTEGLRVEAHPDRLNRALLNVLRNAAEHSPAGGTLTLRCRAGQETRQARARPVVMLEIADAGSGVDPTVEPHLFTPFAAGARPGGHGLGLALAAHFVAQHGGHLQYQTQPGRGTTFTIVLPRSTAPAIAAAPALTP